jgi:hypothetical protein
MSNKLKKSSQTNQNVKSTRKRKQDIPEGQMNKQPITSSQTNKGTKREREIEQIPSPETLYSNQSNCQNVDFPPETFPPPEIKPQGNPLLDFTLLSNAVALLTKQISQTQNLPPTGVEQDYANQSDVFCNQKNIRKGGKIINVINEAYEGTVRISGLFRTSQIRNISSISDNQIEQINLLTQGLEKPKIAFQYSEGTPNSTLAVSLNYALNYIALTNTNFDIDYYYDEVSKIYEAARNQKGSDEGGSEAYSDTANAIYDEFLKKLRGDPNKKSEDKVVEISRVFGPLLNKGLSDISQAGELLKYYILKYIETFYAEKEDVQYKKLPEFWDTTKGLPYLEAFSSDKIASVLGVLLQKLGNNQLQSICPRKHDKGNFLVCYIPYKYISFMMLLSSIETGKKLNLYLTEDFTKNDGIIQQIVENRQDFLIQVITSFRTILEIDFIFDSSNFYNELRNLISSLYEYYKESNPDFFSLNVYNTINKLFKSGNNEIKTNLDNEEITILDGFYNIYTSSFIKKKNIGDIYNFLTTIFNFFSKFIQNNLTIIKDNQQQLTELFEGLELNFEIELPSWTGILYSTISYYDNCEDFSNNKSIDELLKIYLDVCKTEILCARYDVQDGHDQSAFQVKNVSENFTELCKQSSILSQSEKNVSFAQSVTQTQKQKQTQTQTQKQKQKQTQKQKQNEEKSSNMEVDYDVSTDDSHGKKEKVFCKKLIDNEKFASVVLSYNPRGDPTLFIIKTDEIDKEYILDTTTFFPAATTKVVDISPIGPANTFASIDYLKGTAPSVSQSRSAIRNFESNEELISYLQIAKFTELRFSTTNFDAAAPSGCGYRDIGNQCVSYTIIPGERDELELIYVILTIDLNREKHKNNLEQSMIDCIMGVQGKDIFRFKPNSPFKNMGINFSANVDNRKTKKNMENFIEKCYKNPNHSIRKMLETNYDSEKLNNLFNSIKQKLDKINEVYKDTKNYGKIVEARNTLTTIIPSYYDQIIELLSNFDIDNNLIKDDIDAVAVNNFIQLYGECLFNKKFDKLVHKYFSSSGTSSEEKLSIAEASEKSSQAVESLMSLKRQKTEDNKPDVIKPLFINQGTEESKNQDTMEEEDDESGYVSDSPIIYQEPEEDRWAKLIMNYFNVDEKETAKDIYGQANVYFKDTARPFSTRMKWFNDPDKLKLLDVFIQKKYNPYLNKQNKLGFARRKGGKIKTKKIHKKYKHKLTKRKINHQNKKTRHKLKKRKKNTRRNK